MASIKTIRRSSLSTIPLTVFLAGPSEQQIETLVREAIVRLEDLGIKAAPKSTFGLTGHDEVEVFFMHSPNKTDVVIATFGADIADPQHSFTNMLLDVLAEAAKDNNIPFAG